MTEVLGSEDHKHEEDPLFIKEGRVRGWSEEKLGLYLSLYGHGIVDENGSFDLDKARRDTAMEVFVEYV